LRLHYHQKHIKNVIFYKTPETKKFARLFYFFYFILGHPGLIYAQNKKALLVYYPRGLGLKADSQTMRVAHSLFAPKEKWCKDD
jgi:hypothetical protein